MEEIDLPALIAALVVIAVGSLAFLFLRFYLKNRRNREASLVQKLKRETDLITSAMNQIKKTSSNIEVIIDEVKARESYVAALESELRAMEEKKKGLQEAITDFQDIPPEIIDRIKGFTLSTQTNKKGFDIDAFERKNFWQQVVFLFLGAILPTLLTFVWKLFFFLKKWLEL